MRKKPKIILLPGWTYTLDNIKLLAKELKDAGYQVDLQKIPGLTGEPLKKAWSLADYRQWLLSVVREHQQRVVLIGHSHGGRIILSLLAKYDLKQVAAAVLIASAGVVDKRPLTLFKRQCGRHLAKLSGSLKKWQVGRRWFYRLIGERDYLVANPVMRQTMSQVITEDLLPVVGKIKVPVYLLWGKKDRSTPYFMAEQLAKTIPLARLSTFANAGHNLITTHHQQLAQDICQYLETLNEI